MIAYTIRHLGRNDPRRGVESHRYRIDRFTQEREFRAYLGAYPAAVVVKEEDIPAQYRRKQEEDGWHQPLRTWRYVEFSRLGRRPIGIPDAWGDAVERANRAKLS